MSKQTIKTTVAKTSFNFVPFTKGLELWADTQKDKRAAGIFCHLATLVREMKKTWSISDFFYFQIPMDDEDFKGKLVDLFDNFVNWGEKNSQVIKIPGIYEYEVYSFKN